MPEHFITYKLAEIPEAAKELLSVCKNRKKFAFYGNMGAGKTTLIKAVSKELGSRDEAVSPTFSLINEYKCSSAGAGSIYHIDLYRIEDLQEALDIGIEDYLYDDNYCFVEWPQVIEALLPEDIVRVKIDTIDKNNRKIKIYDGEGKAA